MKLGLGTTQFGLDYGISNKNGKTTLEEAGKILALAQKEGLKFIDTAPVYGESEKVLGELFDYSHKFSIVTKVPKIGKDIIDDDDVRHVEEAFTQSLNDLKQSSLYGLLMHYPEDLLAENGSIIFDKIVSLKKQGLIKKIGLSVYSKSQIDSVLSIYSGIDLIQAPINVLDQRLIYGDYLKKLKKNGIEIHSRSTFLQGLLLMDSDEIIKFPQDFRLHLKRIRLEMKKNFDSIQQACLAFVLENDDIDGVVCGVNSASHLTEIIQNAKDLNHNKWDFSDYAINDEKILDPSNWRLL